MRLSGLVSKVINNMPRVLVYGGNGALGKAVVSQFKSKGWDTVSVDFGNSDVAAHSVVIKGSSKEDIGRVIDELQKKNVAGMNVHHTNHPISFYIYTKITKITHFYFFFLS